MAIIEIKRVDVVIAKVKDFGILIEMNVFQVIIEVLNWINA